jgi:hypothetical protein
LESKTRLNSMKQFYCFPYKLYNRLNHILEQNHQKPQNIQNLKIGLFLLILRFFSKSKNIFMKIQYNLIFENKKHEKK